MAINKETKSNTKLWVFLSFVITIGALYISEAGTQLFEMGILGSAYDSLAKNLLKLEANVDPEAIMWETFTVKGKNYMYFGPFPAFIRIILNFISTRLYGQWTCLLQIVAYALTLIFITKSILFMLKSNTQLEEKNKSILAIFSITLFAFGSPIFFLLTHASIYMEAMIWSLAFSFGTIYFFLKYNFDQKNKELNLLTMSILIGFTLLCRITVAIPLASIFFFSLIRAFFNRKISKSKIILILTPLALMIGFQSWYNFKRFGSIFNTYDVQYYRAGYTPTMDIKIKRFLQDFYSLPPIDLNRIPGAIKAYLFDFNSHKVFFGHFPYIRYARPLKTLDKNNYCFIDPILPLSFISSWLLVFSLFGLFYLWISKLDWELKCASLFFIFSLIPVLGFYAIVQRYVAEFVPLLFYLYLFFLYKIKFDSLKKHKLILVTIILMCLISIYATVANSLWCKSTLFGRKPNATRARIFLYQTDLYIIRSVRKMQLSLQPHHHKQSPRKPLEQANH